jgi:PIN domain nuclease of toxin-antitoxin system
MQERGHKEKTPDRDPFDRMLISLAIAHSLAIVTRIR